MNYKSSLLETIVKHPAVSRAISGGKPETPGIVPLVKARRALRDIKRAKRNAREEGPNANPDSGVTGPFTPPGQRLIREALAAGLPDDLAELCRQFIA